MLVEQTNTLRELFLRNSPYCPCTRGFTGLSALRSHAFYETFQVVTSAARIAARNTDCRINAAVQATRQFSPTVMDHESALLLQEAELLAASNAIKDLIVSLKSAHAQCEKSGSLWGAVLTVKGEGATATTIGKPSSQMLLHLQIALESNEVTIGRWRLLLALCKEELMLYKQEMFSFGRVGVLSCKDPAKAGCDDVEDSTEECKTAAKPAGKMNLLGGCSVRKPKQAARAVVSVVDHVMKEAAKRVTAAPLPLNSHIWSAIRGAQNGFEDAWCPNGFDVPVPQFEYSAEEELQLKQANVALEQHQKQLSAEDAKVVEASVRELSQLTSLISERVVQQNEQFSILLRNTETAQNNMEKGIGEVKQTLTHFWNPTRQLIVVLWTSILILVVANWIIR